MIHSITNIFINKTLANWLFMMCLLLTIDNIKSDILNLNMNSYNLYHRYLLQTFSKKRKELFIDP